MGDDTHRDEVDARFGNRTHGVQRDSARSFHALHAPFCQAHRFAQGLQRHIVQKERVRARLDGLLNLLQRRAFHLHPQRMGRMGAGASNRLTNIAAERKQMVVFYQDSVIQPDAVIDPAPNAHRILLQQAQSGRGLARVGDSCPCALHGVHESACEGGDTRQVLEEVQRGALAHQNRARGTPQAQNARAGREPRAVRKRFGKLNGGVQSLEHAPSDFHTAEDTLRLRQNRALGLRVGRDERDGRPIARADVLLQRARNRLLEIARLQPVHGQIIPEVYSRWGESRMTATMAFLIVLMVAFGGILAYGGDWLGRRLGKQRLSLLGMRPRYTATLTATLTGALTVALTITGMTLANEAFRVWITRGDQILIELRRNEQLLKERAKALESLQAEVKSKTDELNRLQDETKNLKKQVSTLQYQLKTGQKQLAQMEESLRQEEERVQALHQERDLLRQNVQDLRQQSNALRQEIAQLKRTQEQLSKQNSEFAQENIRLTSENAHLEKQNQQLSAQNAQLEARNRELSERNQQLADQNRLLLDRTTELRLQQDELRRSVNELLGLVNIRLMPIAFHAGEELTRVAFREGLSEVRVRQMLQDMLKTAADYARARGASPGADGRTVFIPEKVVRLTTGEQVRVDESASLETILHNIRASGEPVAALVVAVTNTAKGEPVPVEVRLFRNHVIFQAGQEIARTILDCRPAKDPFQQIVAFLQGDIRETAISAGLIPRMELQGTQPTVGEMDAPTLLALVEKARQCPGDRALLIARARQEIRAGDSLQLEFEVRPLSSAGRGG